MTRAALNQAKRISRATVACSRPRLYERTDVGRGKGKGTREIDGTQSARDETPSEDGRM